MPFETPVPHASRADRIPAPLLVLGGIVSVQFGAALAATLIPAIGAAGSVLLRLGIAAIIMLAVVRPRWRGHSRQAWLVVGAFGVVLGLMNLAFYATIATLPIGVAVTIEFIGPLSLAAALSRRWLDGLAVLAAGVGVLFISEALSVPWEDLDRRGLALALLTGVFWAGYVVLSGRTGRLFPSLDGAAIAMCIGALLILPVGLPSVTTWTWPDVAKGVGIAVLSSALPYSLELLALRRLTTAVFGILLSLEPAVAATAGLVVLGQTLHSWQLIGMALVVLASALIMGTNRRRAEDTPSDLTETGG